MVKQRFSGKNKHFDDAEKLKKGKHPLVEYIENQQKKERKHPKVKYQTFRCRQCAHTWHYRTLKCPLCEMLMDARF